jgi:hypothetical protein
MVAEKDSIMDLPQKVLELIPSNSYTENLKSCEDDSPIPFH